VTTYVVANLKKGVFYMFSKRKGFTLVELLIVIIVIGILAGGMMLASGSATDSAKASTLISELRNAKAAGIMFLGDNTDETWATILGVWPTLNAIGSSFDQYMDNPDKVRQLDFQVAVVGGESWLLVGKNVSDPIVAKKMIGMAGGALWEVGGSQFGPGDTVAYMRVK
jgi:general secretion pathway protein G